MKLLLSELPSDSEPSKYAELCVKMALIPERLVQYLITLKIYLKV